MHKKENVNEPAMDLPDRLRDLNALRPETDLIFVVAAFDKDRDLGPGLKNPLIYSAVRSDIDLLPGREGKAVSCMIVQEEFRDIDFGEGYKLADLTARTYPVGAIPFSEADFLDANQFINAVERPIDAAERILSQKVRQVAAELHGGGEGEALGDARKYVGNAASWINRCIADPLLFADFARLPGFVLPPLVRPSAGAFGVEIHELPDPEKAQYCEKGLVRPYQRACVNRAIFDAVYPTALRSARYVNTQHVADAIPAFGLGAVVVCYGFFPHSERVRRTVAATLWNRGVEIPPERIIERPVYGDWLPGGQMWCVSLGVFDEYTHRGAFR